MAQVPTKQVPTVHHRRVGDLVVTTLSDGYVDAGLDVVQVVSPEEAEAMVREGCGRSAPRISVNMFALRAPGRTLLVDAGSGSMMGPSCGRLPESLAAAGIDPADVDAILLTHVHPDHSCGLTGDDGRALFPRAEVIVHEAEMWHWFDDAAMAAATERARTRYFEGARFRLGPYRDRIRTFAEGEVAGDLLPGIVGVPCPGHTPGHCAYRVRSGTEEVLIWGDTVHVPELQVPRPDITMLFDADPAQAAASRRAIFDLVVADDPLVAGMHLHFPGFARMRRDGRGEKARYRLVTEPWTYEI